MRFVRIISVVLFLGLSWAATACAEVGGIPCNIQGIREIFRIKAYEGVSHNQQHLRELLPYSKLEYDFLKLGSGGNGSVFRVIPKKVGSSTFIVKFSTVDQVLHDYFGFELLRDLSKDQNFVKIPRIEILTKNRDEIISLSDQGIMKMDDIRGRDLFEVLADPQVPVSVRADLRRKYSSFLNHVKSKLDATTRFVTRKMPLNDSYYPAKQTHLNVHELDNFDREVALQPEGLSARMNLIDFFSRNRTYAEKLKQVSNGKPLWFEKQRIRSEMHLILKSDNFLVNESNELFLIDPY